MSKGKNIPRKIELLAPARDAITAIEAIKHGADAVYMGAASHGARAAAGNSLEDITKVVEFAHQFNAKVYITINTIVYNDEIEKVEQLIHSLYRIGVDALIVQDMGILRMNIPPIALHASTQCDTRSVEKAKFLEQVGFSQIVLARELSFEEIAEIHNQVNVPLEAFVHGALCVSYSGDCQASWVATGRSANRGECAQFCRLPYNLEDKDGNILIKDKHLLSLKDMNRSNSIEDLLDAGVSSLKIEGRLKDVEYVKNITAYYRSILDEIFSRRSEYTPASSGKTKINFTPNPYKSFNRGFTQYYTGDKNFKDIASINTPKSIGEEVGYVKSVQKNFIEISSKVELHNGDGLCFTSKDGKFSGFGINRVEGERIYPSRMPEIKRGDIIFRNNDTKFGKLLSVPSAERKIGITIHLFYKEKHLKLQISDDKGNSILIEELCEELEIAKTLQRNNQQNQLSKLGNTPFEAISINVDETENLFIPSSLIAKMRREATDKLINLRIKNHPRPEQGVNRGPKYYHSEVSFEANISNKKAKEFYVECGVKEISPAYELKPIAEAPLMTTIHCIRRTCNKCLKTEQGKEWKEPLFLVTDKTKLQLHFD